MNKGTFVCLVAALIVAAMPAQAEQAGEEITVTGEILDMVCYLDSGLRGKDHKDCAASCIKGGTPVGIKSEEDGKVYLVIGYHKPMNDELAKYAAEIITLRGKHVERDGIHMLENAEIVE